MTTAVEHPEEIERRIARFRRSVHAGDLWPDISLTVFRAAEVELGRVAATILAGVPDPVVLRSDLGARALGVAAFMNGVGPLFGHWCETARLVAEPAITRMFATHLEHGRRRVARLRFELERVLVAMAARGIEAWVLKGMHTAYRYFPEPGARVSTDIDLFVRPADWLGARDALTEVGLVETRVESDPQDSAWAPREGQRVRSLTYLHAEGPWSIDLHRSLDWVPFHGLETALGGPDQSSGEVWNEYCLPVRVLAQPLLLAYLALHASSHFYGMTQIRLIELVLVARRDFARDEARWGAFAALVDRTGSGRFVYPALRLAERLVPGTFHRGVLDGITQAAPRRLRRLVASMTPASAQRVHPFPSLRERFVWVASPREALAALWWLVWPREGERPVAPHHALVAQWRRVRRALGRVVLARAGR